MAIIKKWVVTRVAELDGGEDDFLPNYVINMLEDNKVHHLPTTSFHDFGPTLMALDPS